ncbi:MAG: xanthine dehydrogenase family protein molybdopterin-binding subunit, partial [Burkholderiales bacterium]
MAEGSTARLTVTGQPVDRIDGPLKVEGAAKYAAEYDAPDLLHAAVVSSAIAKGRIVSIDAGPALALPGVIEVLTHENRPHASIFNLAYKDTVAPPGHPLRPLYDDKIHFNGQPIAVVIAETYEAARDGAALVKATYAIDDHITDFEAAKREAYDPPEQRLFIPRTPKPRGDVDAALASAAVRIAATYSTGAEHHNPMELFGTTLVWHGDGKVTVYDKTQGSQNVQLYLKTALGFKIKDTRVVNAYVGGAFGSGLRPQYSVFLAALAAKKLKRSVRLVLTREQMFGLGYRPNASQTIEMACDAGGILKAIRHDAVAATSAMEHSQEVIVDWSALLYKCENVALSYKLATVDTSSPTDMRAPGAATGHFALESAMDELAFAASIDPLTFRRKNFVDHDQIHGREITSKELLACYEQGAARFGWSRRSAKPRSMQDGRELVGWGVAGGMWDARVAPTPTRARVSWRSDGTLDVAAAASDIGTGTYTILAQIAGEEFAVPAHKVRVRLGDSSLPFNPVEGGSWMAASTGAAVKSGCDKLKAKILKAVRKLEGVRKFKDRDILFSEGRVKGSALPEGGISIAELLTQAGDEAFEAMGTAMSNVLAHNKYISYTHSAVFVEVRIDEELGVVRIPRVVSAIAAGRILNPKTAR